MYVCSIYIYIYIYELLDASCCRVPRRRTRMDCPRRTVRDFPLYKGFPFTRDFPLEGISLYKGFLFIRDFPV